MSALETLLPLILNSANNVSLAYTDDAREKFCLIKKRYTSSPGSRKDDNGKTHEEYLVCGRLVIHTHDEATWKLYRSSVENYLNETSDEIRKKFWYPIPKDDNPNLYVDKDHCKVVKIAKPEFAELIKLIEAKREEIRPKIQELKKRFIEEIEQLGRSLIVSDFGYNADQEHWIEGLQIKDDWFDLREEPDFSNCSIELLFHSNTPLYRALEEKNFETEVGCC